MCPRDSPRKTIFRKPVSRAISHSRFITSREVNDRCSEVIELVRKLNRARVRPVVFQIGARKETSGPEFLRGFPRAVRFVIVELEPDRAKSITQRVPDMCRFERLQTLANRTELAAARGR